MSEVAAFDITLNDGIGGYRTIAAGEPIPAEFKDHLEEWRKRGLVGEEAAEESSAFLPAHFDNLKEVTQEDVDAEELRIQKRAQERSDKFAKAQEEAEQAEAEGKNAYENLPSLNTPEEAKADNQARAEAEKPAPAPEPQVAPAPPKPAPQPEAVKTAQPVADKQPAKPADKAADKPTPKK